MRMRVLLAVLLIAFTSISLSVPVYFSQAYAQGDLRQSAVGNVLLDQAAGVLTSNLPGPHFRAGETVSLTDRFSGDVYAAGNSVQLSGTISGDLLVAGGTVQLSGEVSDDVRVAGGTVIIDGIIGKNITVAGGTVTFTKSSQVGGSVVVAGGTVVLEGQVKGNVYGASGTVTMPGSIGGNVAYDTGILTIPQSASIAGSLRATVERQPEVSNQARISGSRDVKVREQAQRRQLNSQSFQNMVAAGMLTQLIVSSIMAIAVGSLLLFLMPRFWETATAPLQSSFFSTLGWGLTTVLLLPLAIVLLVMSVVGLPLAVILISVAMIIAVIAGWISAYALGRLIYRKSEVEWLENRYVQLIVGVLVINTLGIIPVMGWILTLAAFIVGVGALVVGSKSMLTVQSVQPATRARTRKITAATKRSR